MLSPVYSGHPWRVYLLTLASRVSLSVYDLICAAVTSEALSHSINRTVSAGVGTSLIVLGKGNLLNPSALLSFVPGRCSIW